MQTPYETAVAVARKLQGKERFLFLQTLARSKAYRAAMEDIIDGAVIEERRADPSRLLSDYLAESRRRKR